MIFLAQIQELNVYMIPEFEGKLLVLKRKNGLWEFPGGGVDWGEKPEQSASRELREETGLSAIEPKFICVSSATYKTPDGNDKHSVYLVYKCAVSSSSVILCEEHDEFRWMFPREIKYLKLGLNAEEAMELLEEK